jgi:hypothetical protein
MRESTFYKNDVVLVVDLRNQPVVVPYIENRIPPRPHPYHATYCGCRKFLLAIHLDIVEVPNSQAIEDAGLLARKASGKILAVTQ